MALPTTGLCLHSKVALDACFTSRGNPPSGVPVDGSTVQEWQKTSSAAVSYAWDLVSGTDGGAIYDFDGMGNAALYFDGNTSVRRGLDTRTLAGTDDVYGTAFYAVLAPFTWAVSFRVASWPASGRGSIFGTLNGGRTQLAVGSDGHLFVRWMAYNSVVSIIDLGAIELNRSYSVILRYTRSGGDQLQVYVDDATTPVYNAAIATAQDHSYRPFGIGGEVQANANYFNGWIGEVAVYNTYVTGDTLTDLMSYLTTSWPNAPAGAPDVSSASRVPRPVYVLPSVVGLRKWVDYLPVVVSGTSTAAQVGTYDDGGCLHTVGVESIEGLTAGVDYLPVYLVDEVEGKRWRYDDEGFIPISNV